jgi:hypothetical protein
MTESEFLLKLTLSQFNRQYRQDIKANECDIRLIDTAKGSDRSYWITTRRDDDFVKLRINITFSDNDTIEPFRLEVNGTAGIFNLNDEVFVSTATVRHIYREHGTYKFLSLEDLVYSEPLAILMENGAPLLLENGYPILMEK